MSKPRVFISYSHKDEPWKDRFVSHLGIAEKQGLLQTWDDRQLRGGDDWFNEIMKAIENGSVAVLLVSHNSLTSNFILNEEVPRMLAQRELQKARFYPVVVEACDWEAVEWLKPFNLRPRDGRPVGINNDGKRTEEQINQDLAAIVKEIRLLPPLESVAPLNHECPYLGLEAFTEDKRHLFFGRDNFIEAILQKLQERAFVAVVGPSGSGKSSVVQAGVFPRLGSEWHKLVFQPGDDPFLNLADKFVELRGARYPHFSARSKAVEDMAQQIRESRSIADVVIETLAALPPNAQPSRLIVVADQFEELFTLTPTADRQPFVEVLLAASHLAELKVLVTLRADFFGQAISLTPELSQLIQDGIVPHRPLQRVDWEAVILKPAETVGLHVEPALVSLILEETEAQPDSLPLLEYALKELWQHRAQNRIGLAQYEAIGKLAGAINQRADSVLAQLTEEQQTLALRTLTRLVRVSGGEEEGADTRLRLPLNELTAEQREVLQSFINERLLVTNRHDRTGGETIEVAHEALIRRWERLREALDSDREFLLWRRRLDFRRRDWEEHQRDESLLLQGVLLEEAKHWLNKRGPDIFEPERTFITWADRAEHQIEKILPQLSDLASISFVPVNGEQQCRDCFLTLTLCYGKELALKIAREVADSNARANALTSLAKTLIKIGQVDQAKLVIIEALRVVLAVKNINNLVRTLAYVGELATELGLANEAMQAAKEIEDEDAKGRALITLVAPFVKNGKAKMILQEGRQLNDFEAQAQLLSITVNALANSGRIAEARQIAIDALDTIKNIGSFLGQAYALSTLCITLAGIQQIDLLQRVADEALTVVDKVDEKSPCVQILSSIAHSLLTSDQLGQAEFVASKALRIAESVEDSHARLGIVSSVVDVLARLGLKAEVLRVAHKMQSDFYRSSIQKDLAEALMRAGVAEEALSLAGEIEFARIRSLTISAIAQLLAKSEELGKALITARKVEEDEERASALAVVATAFAEAGQPEKARHISYEIEDWYQRVNAQTAIAKSWLDSNCIKEAQEIVDEVRTAIGKINIDIHRSIARGYLASLLARLHFYRDARETAEQCAYSKDRLAAYTTILREYHIERNPSLARLFAEKAA
jgi:tetratricopeptide (TPR) repeat protein